jgi:hypothetical protein
MRVFAQVLNGKLHWKFSANELPPKTQGMLIIDITDLNPQPCEGWAWDGNKFIVPTNNLENVKEDTTRLINCFVGNYRIRYITPLIFQDAVYRLKLEAVAKYRADGTVSPILQDEASALGKTIQQVVDSITAANTLCNEVLIHLEKIRVEEKAFIDGATSVENAIARRQEIVARLQEYEANGLD